MQMLNMSLGNCIKSLIGKEGVSSFYKGVYSPLYSIPAINAIVFGAYEMARRFLASTSDSDLTLGQGINIIREV